MEKEVVISIKGVQKYEGTAPDTMELVTKAASPGRERAIPSPIRRASSPAWRAP